MRSTIFAMIHNDIELHTALSAISLQVGLLWANLLPFDTNDKLNKTDADTRYASLEI